MVSTLVLASLDSAGAGRFTRSHGTHSVWPVCFKYRAFKTWSLLGCRVAVRRLEPFVFGGFLEPQSQSVVLFNSIKPPFSGASRCQANIENAQNPDDDYLTTEVSYILCNGVFLWNLVELLEGITS